MDKKGFTLYTILFWIFVTYFYIACIFTGENFLNEKSPAGSYDGSLKVKAQPDPSCDPSQQPCEMWLPGTYTVNMGKLL